MSIYLYELTDKYMNAPDPIIFIRLAWEDSSKNSVAVGYVAGTIDALYYAKKINQQEYTDLYHMIGL